MAVDDLEEPLPRIRTVRVGEFEFCHESGVLSRQGDGSSALEARANGERLAPKPAALLAMLVERRGGLVTRSEIREQLWSDVTVDFDNSLNYCVRQVRQAFGDSAISPRYIETVPGRGYRLKPGLFASSETAKSEAKPELFTGTEANGEPRPELFPLPTETANGEPDPDRRELLPVSTETAKTEAEDRSTAARGISRRTLFAALAIGGAATLGAGAWLALRRGGDRETGARRLRIAILPFAHAAMTPAVALQSNQVEARVLADLTTQGRDFLDVIGPRTTGPLVAENLPMQRIAATLEVHSVLHVRAIGDEMLFELIRTSDRAHLYARRMAELSQVDAVAAKIVAGVLAALEAER